MAFPTPTPGASLILSFNLRKKSVLIVGHNQLAASRALAALEADSEVTLLADPQKLCDELAWRAENGQINLVDPQSIAGDDPAQILENYLHTRPSPLFICITDSILSIQSRSHEIFRALYMVCRSRGILVNITDMPELCDFSFTSTHRFKNSAGSSTSLQLGITTNGKGCRMASRLRREVVASVPADAGQAVENIAQLRALAKQNSQLADSDDQPSTPNTPVEQPNKFEVESDEERVKRRMRWVAQVSEYWPMSKLAALSKQEDFERVLADSASSRLPGLQATLHDLSTSPARKGRILLIGSGPGHPSLLTVAAKQALMSPGALILSDKLVPSAVLDLVPKTSELRVARKFPGNADGAQAEMMEMAVEAARLGRTVVRLKQGDPVVYGRAGEEVLYCREHGFEPIIVPGVSSVLAGPTFAGIPVTQRGAAESFIVCTGVGRKGKEVLLPGYDRGRTLVVLMGVARITQVISTLINATSPGRVGETYPEHLPIALIERASMPDQRVIFSTLKDIVAALESVLEQRPPGMFVIGWSVLSLHGAGDMEVLDDGAEKNDAVRIGGWLDGQRWRVVEGIEEEWSEL